ncbi:MAG: hypothetical protein QOF89_2665 [Acidobacteriota bacterium]|jgi:hypothetical protein|nr:hypothetical protein [Acidobacteriota bacterium]
MNAKKSLTFLTALLGLVLTAGTARAADWVKIISFNPASPASLSGVPTGSPMGPGNSIEVTFTYNLESKPSGRIGFFTAGEPGNPPHTGVELPFTIAKKGRGEGKTRFSVQCSGTFTTCHITKVRYNLFHDSPGGLVNLFEGHATVDFTFKCPPSTQPGHKPNITSARPGLYIWGSDPTHKHWVSWGSGVKLTAAESIFPKKGNGQCAFNVEYYEKETNGVATGPFKNRIFSDANVRAINGPDTLNAGQAKSVVTQPYLDPGSHTLTLRLDADGNVTESNEGDNSFSIRYRLEGRCVGPIG